ncbi:hypothetical protein BGZ57DRAFT_855011 [Hyaloscypha finlandica]|nr:hypothetical protein BGZ57DRAFT_855011 [Hyaloscypha finlandica]
MSHDLPFTPQTSPMTFSFVFPSPLHDLPSHHIFSWLCGSQKDYGMKRSSSHTANFSKDSHLNQYSLNNNWGNQGYMNHVPGNNDDLFSYLDNSQDYSVDTYPGYNMAPETPAVAAPTESGNTAGYSPKLQCSVPECSQDRKFPSESALRKHEAKHSKSYICPVPNCKHTRFGDKGGLDRHNREIHGSQTHCCPITSCKRHVRGFPRKYNLSEHQKRCHSSQLPNLAPLSILEQQNHTSDSMKGQQESYEGGSSPEMATGGGGG